MCGHRAPGRGSLGDPARPVLTAEDEVQMAMTVIVRGLGGRVAEHVAHLERPRSVLDQFTHELEARYGPQGGPRTKLCSFRRKPGG